MEPVVAKSDDPAALTEADREIVMKQYEDLAKLMFTFKTEAEYAGR